MIVKPSTFVRWHRAGFRVFWRWKSRSPGHPPLPKNLQALILTIAREDPSWGEERIADERSLKLGVGGSAYVLFELVAYKSAWGPRGSGPHFAHGGATPFTRAYAIICPKCSFA